MNQPVSLCIATPMYGGMCNAAYVQSLYEMTGYFFERGIKAELMLLTNESLVSRARNRLVQDFLDYSEATHLLFIDADMGFNAQDIVRMIASDVDIVGGVYPLKGINWEWIRLAALNGVMAESLPYEGTILAGEVSNGEPAMPERNGIYAVNALGGGFLLIQREAFAKLSGHVQTYAGDNSCNANGSVTRRRYHEFFSSRINPDTEELMGEDFYFCWLARQHGLKVYAAPWARLSHVGSYTFGPLYPWVRRFEADKCRAVENPESIENNGRTVNASPENRHQSGGKQ